MGRRLKKLSELKGGNEGGGERGKEEENEPIVPRPPTLNLP